MDTPAKIRVLLVDDEPPARARLRHFLEAEKEFQIVGECGNGSQTVDAIQRERPDVVFLDVQMPRGDGFAVCEKVGVERMPLVVFVTAYDQFALRAFEVHALDYLLKPFDRARFHKTLQQVRHRLDRGRSEGWQHELQTLLENLKTRPRRADRLALRIDGKLVFVRADEIDWVEADGNYVRLHVGATEHLVRETLLWCESQLPADRFLRISRSVIVNTDRIKEIQPLFYGDQAVHLRSGARLTLSRTYRERLETFLAAQRVSTGGRA